MGILAFLDAYEGAGKIGFFAAIFVGILYITGRMIDKFFPPKDR